MYLCSLEAVTRTRWKQKQLMGVSTWSVHKYSVDHLTDELLQRQQRHGPDLTVGTAEILNAAEDINNASQNINLLLKTGWTFYCWPDCRLQASTEALKPPTSRSETWEEDVLKVSLTLYTFYFDSLMERRRTGQRYVRYGCHGNKRCPSPSPPASISPAELQRVAGTTPRPRRQIIQQDAETEDSLLQTETHTENIIKQTSELCREDTSQLSGSKALWQMYTFLDVKASARFNWRGYCIAE